MVTYRLLCGFLATIFLFSLTCCSTGKSVVQNQNDQPDLQARLLRQLNSAFNQANIDPDRESSSAPDGKLNRVADIQATVLAELETYQVSLRWTEKMVADYNLDGEVNLGDITPLAIYFNQQVPIEPSSDNVLAWRLRRVDGNGDGEINLSDVTPIAKHWKENLDGYRVFRRDSLGNQTTVFENGEESEKDLSCPRNQVIEDGVITYKITDCGVLPGDYEYWVVPVDSRSGEEGIESKICTVELPQLPIVENRTWQSQTLWSGWANWINLVVANQQPVIAFVDNHGADILVSKAQDQSCSNWSQPSVLIEGANAPTLAATDEGAMLAWFQAREGDDGSDLCFSQTTDFVPGDLEPKVVVEEVSNYFATSCQHGSIGLAMYNGNPVISYCTIEGEGGEFGTRWITYYTPYGIAALDPAGNTWHSPDRLMLRGPAVSFHMKIVEHDGLPIIKLAPGWEPFFLPNGTFVASPYITQYLGNDYLEWNWAEPMGVVNMVGSMVSNGSDLYMVSVGQDPIENQLDTLYVYRADDPVGTFWLTSSPVETVTTDIVTRVETASEGNRVVAVFWGKTSESWARSAYFMYSVETEDIASGRWGPTKIVDGPFTDWPKNDKIAAVEYVDGVPVVVYPALTADGCKAEVRVARLE